MSFKEGQEVYLRSDGTDLEYLIVLFHFGEESTRSRIAECHGD